MNIQERKKDHVDLTVAGDVHYEQSAGFDRYHFIHNALPETNLKEVSTVATLLGRTFSFPLFISSMTGGYNEGRAVNAIIAKFCEENNLPFGVGSQRAMLENRELAHTFSVVREEAPTAFIAANIGGGQLVGGLSKNQVEILIETIHADAVIVHLNPLQELMQTEGDQNFKGVEAGIQQLVKDSTVPVIVKETGAGISAEVARRLLNADVAVIDVAGAGGTSWAKVENSRKTKIEEGEDNFNEWGLPTAECIRQVAELKEKKNFELIASGGIRSSFDIAKSLCLGADFAAAAQPVIKAVVNDGRRGLELLLDHWSGQLRKILLLLGCEQLEDLSRHHLQITHLKP